MMAKILNRLVTVIALFFITVVFVACFPFLAVWFVVTGKDLTNSNLSFNSFHQQQDKKTIVEGKTINQLRENLKKDYAEYKALNRYEREDDSIGGKLKRNIESNTEILRSIENEIAKAM